MGEGTGGVVCVKSGSGGEGWNLLIRFRRAHASLHPGPPFPQTSTAPRDISKIATVPGSTFAQLGKPRTSRVLRIECFANKCGRSINGGQELTPPSYP
jgi:hypothetical protein